MTLRARLFSEPASALPRYRQTGIWAVRGDRQESTILQYRSNAGAIKGDNVIHGNAGPF